MGGLEYRGVFSGSSKGGGGGRGGHLRERRAIGRGWAARRERLVLLRPLQAVMLADDLDRAVEGVAGEEYLDHLALAEDGAAGPARRALVVICLDVEARPRQPAAPEIGTRINARLHHALLIMIQKVPAG